MLAGLPSYYSPLNLFHCILKSELNFREDGLVSPAPSYGLDWFEGAIAQPDKVLQDFIHAVNPSNSSVRPSSHLPSGQCRN